MRVSYYFFVGVPLGLILGWVLFFALICRDLGVPNPQSRWIRHLIVKKSELASHIKGPKLLLVGGSGTLFGLSARTIQEQTGFPTVNFGTHAGLGSKYILHIAEETAKPGDIVLLIMEYDLADTTSITDDYIMGEDTGYFWNLPLFDKIELAIRVPYKRLSNFNKKPARPPSINWENISPYTTNVETIDDYGDEIYNLNTKYTSPHSASMKALIIFSDDAGQFASRIDFLRWAKASHVTVIATYPNLLYHPEYDQPPALAGLKSTTDFYTSHGVPVLGTPREAMFPEDQYLDTDYHLLHSAAIVRTERLIPYLKPYLKKPGGS
jgi:hypothetical protein